MRGRRSDDFFLVVAEIDFRDFDDKSVNDDSEKAFEPIAKREGGLAKNGIKTRDIHHECNDCDRKSGTTKEHLIVKRFAGENSVGNGSRIENV